MKKHIYGGLVFITFVYVLLSTHLINYSINIFLIVLLLSVGLMNLFIYKVCVCERDEFDNEMNKNKQELLDYINSGEFSKHIEESKNSYYIHHLYNTIIRRN